MEQRIRRTVISAATAVAAASLASAVALAHTGDLGSRPCPGDCDRNGSVSVDEVVTAVNIALGVMPVSFCEPADLDEDGEIVVSELLAAVANLLDGCPATPTPMSEQTPSPTLAGEPDPTATPPALEPTATASSTPLPDDPTPTPEAAQCGNGVVEPGEHCDGTDDGACPGACSEQCRCPSCESEDAFQVIRERIFNGRGCTVATCHGSFAAADLDLRYGAAYAELVDVLAFNPAARSAGKRRVVPGDAAGSFLAQKLRGALAVGEGDRMPLVGGALSDLELALVDAWIDAGAPGVGPAESAPCLPPDQYVAVEAPPPPPGGYQLLLEGRWLQPGEEEEGCMWIPVPNQVDFAVGRWEFFLNPGTHHFAIFEYNRPGTPPLNTWRLNDYGCFSGAEFGNSVSGTPQAPHFVDTYPPGVARVLRAGRYIGLNAHYYNRFDVPIQIKVWTNIHPHPGPPVHIAETLIAIDDTFTINVPPFSQGTHPGRFVNRTGDPISIFQLTSHMHWRGLRFTARAADGTPIYENFDWAHPVFRDFDPPLVLAPGEGIDFECFYDNGVTRAVRRTPAGIPTNLIFGVSAEDAMCILNGLYYRGG